MTDTVNNGIGWPEHSDRCSQRDAGACCKDCYARWHRGGPLPTFTAPRNDVGDAWERDDVAAPRNATFAVADVNGADVKHVTPPLTVPADDVVADEDELHILEMQAGAAVLAGRREILAQNMDLRDVTAQAWEAIQDANNPPTLFRYGSMPARIEKDDEGRPFARCRMV